MKVLKFGFFSKDDNSSPVFQHELSWSRVYEYPFIIGEIRKYNSINTLGDNLLHIHNCSWGFRDIHTVFKTWLDIKYVFVKHSDILSSTLWNTEIWDITTPSKYKKHFDVVINVSTIEEVLGDHVQIIKNHLGQVKEGGIFIMTFDYPGIQLEKVEEFVGQKIDVPEVKLNPKNSILPDKVLNLPESFNVGYLVIQV